MKKVYLFDVSENTIINIEHLGFKIKNTEEVVKEVVFCHLDGMYSFCHLIDHPGKIINLRGSTEVYIKIKE